MWYSSLPGMISPKLTKPFSWANLSADTFPPGTWMDHSFKYSSLFVDVVVVVVVTIVTRVRINTLKAALKYILVYLISLVFLI